MAVKIEPQQILTNFLRATVSDINSSRSGQWIYPDFPRVEDLGNNQFPRIGITKISESSKAMGIFDNTQWHTVTLQIDVVAKKDRGHSVTSTDSSLGTIANSPRLTYDFIPDSVTNIKHNAVAFGTVTAVNSDASFTAPGSLAAGTVEWSRSTGNLNFSSTDVTDYSGQTITSTWVEFLEGEEATQYLARQVIKQIRANWRTNSNMTGLENPVLISMIPTPFDEANSIFRHIIEYQFNQFNIAEGL